MSMKSEIEERIYKRTGRRVDVYQGMGFQKIRDQLGKSADLTRPTNPELQNKMKRWLASPEDLMDPKYAYLRSNSEYTPSTPANNVVVVDDNKVVPTKSAVSFKTEEQQKDLSGMCVVSSVNDLLEHSPNRPIMFVHIENIENFSPTINNYYQNNDK